MSCSTPLCKFLCSSEEVFHRPDRRVCVRARLCVRARVCGVQVSASASVSVSARSPLRAFAVRSPLALSFVRRSFAVRSPFGRRSFAARSPFPLARRSLAARSPFVRVVQKRARHVVPNVVAKKRLFGTTILHELGARRVTCLGTPAGCTMWWQRSACLITFRKRLSGPKPLIIGGEKLLPAT